MTDEQNKICNLCDMELSLTNVRFTYLGHSFRADVPKCSGCGQVFISEELVKGRIAEVEMELEDK